MSDKTLARRTKLKVFFANSDISADIAKYLISLTYTDNSEDEADDLQIKLSDRDDIWLRSWLNDAIELESVVTGTVVPGTTTYKVTSKSGASIRAGAGEGYSRLLTMPYNTAVNVKAVNNGWAEIIYNDQKAYIKASCIAVDDSEKVQSAKSDMKIQATIVRENWNGNGADDVLDTGEFELDDVETDGPPASISIKGTSLSYSSGIRQTIKSKAWEKYYLSRIVAEISASNGMACMFESVFDPFYTRVEQVETADIAFLQKLCRNAGLSLKVTSNIIVVFDEATYEAMDAVRTITRGKSGEYSKYKLRLGKNDTQYGSCHVSYTDPLTGKTIEGTYTDPNAKDEAQILEITAKVSSIAEAQTVAMKRLRLKNKFAKTGSFTLPGDPCMLSGVTVMLSGWGVYDGKYIIKQAAHSVSSSGYTTTIQIRQVLEGY